MLQARNLDFGERMAMSQGIATNASIKDILLLHIPGAENAHQAAKSNDRQGVDWWVELSTARHIAVDAKVREVDWAATHPDEDDLALETWSVVEDRISGWTREQRKKCDYVLWLWADTGRFCLLPFPMLCSVFSRKWQEWRKTMKTRVQKTNWGSGSYHSECVFVPRRTIWNEIYRQYGGNINVN